MSVDLSTHQPVAFIFACCDALVSIHADPNSCKVSMRASPIALALLAASSAMAQKPQDTEVWTPVPKIITPGRTDAAPPSDAVVLFDGKNLDAWVSANDKSPAKWTVANGVMTVNKAAGDIMTKQSFSNYQIHLEWRIPEGITGNDQARGNS